MDYLQRKDISFIHRYNALFLINTIANQWQGLWKMRCHQVKGWMDNDPSASFPMDYKGWLKKKSNRLVKYVPMKQKAGMNGRHATFRMQNIINDRLNLGYEDEFAFPSHSGKVDGPWEVYGNLIKIQRKPDQRGQIVHNDQ